jgi:hypothetical protein
MMSNRRFAGLAGRRERATLSLPLGWEKIAAHAATNEVLVLHVVTDLQCLERQLPGDHRGHRELEGPDGVSWPP